MKIPFKSKQSLQPAPLAPTPPASNPPSPFDKSGPFGMTAEADYIPFYAQIVAHRENLHKTIAHLKDAEQAEAIASVGLETAFPAVFSRADEDSLFHHATTLLRAKVSVPDESFLEQISLRLFEALPQQMPLALFQQFTLFARLSPDELPYLCSRCECWRFYFPSPQDPNPQYSERKPEREAFLITWPEYQHIQGELYEWRLRGSMVFPEGIASLAPAYEDSEKHFYRVFRHFDLREIEDGLNSLVRILLKQPVSIEGHLPDLVAPQFKIQFDGPVAYINSTSGKQTETILTDLFDKEANLPAGGFHIGSELERTTVAFEDQVAVIEKHFSAAVGKNQKDGLRFSADDVVSCYIVHRERGGHFWSWAPCVVINFNKVIERKWSMWIGTPAESTEIKAVDSWLVECASLSGAVQICQAFRLWCEQCQ